MRKVSVGQWAMLIISGLALLTTFMIGGGGQLLSWITPPVAAASSSHALGSQQHCTEEQQHPSFGGAVVVDTNTVLCGTLTAFGGTVAINGTVIGDVVGFGSAIVIAGTVNGNIDVYGGNVVLRDDSRLYGEINLYDGQWTRGLNVHLVGDVHNHTEQYNCFFPTGCGFSFPLLQIITWVALGLLLTTLLPEHVMIVRTTVSSKGRRSLLLGLLSVVLAPPLLVVLIALILSIPVAIIVALGIIAGWAMGTVAIGWIVGEHVLSKIAPQRNSRPLQVAVGLTAIVLVGSLPYIGWIISVLVGLLGVGAVFLSRFGTRLYVQPRKPLTM